MSHKQNDIITEDQAEQRQELIESLKIDYSAVFVPFSQSRNKDQDHKSLNWKVTLKRNNTELTTDYMQGIGHLTIPEFPKVSDYWRRSLKERCEELSSETGKKCIIFMDDVKLSFKPIPSPDLESVLWSLIMDSDVLEYDSFESWASEFGYDTDSRTADKTYNDCLKIALKLKHMFTGDELEQLRESYQDY